MFAEATGDYQWIHVDRELAFNGPFGGTIAHGYLTASLLPVLTQQIFKVQAKMGINYGLNKLRFPAPVRVGSSVRAMSTLQDVTDVGDAVQLVVNTIVHVDGSAKPCRGGRVGEQILLVNAERGLDARVLRNRLTQTHTRQHQPRASRGRPERRFGEDVALNFGGSRVDRARYRRQPGV